MRRFRRIEDVFRGVCAKCGYKEVRTPTVEYLHLFTAAGTLTPGSLSKVYSFLDWDGWSGERVVLRPDGTIPVARLYIDNISREKIARLFYVTNIFAFEETGKEDREKWQCGVELIGAGSTAADAELVNMALLTLRELGLKDVGLKLSHAGLIRALLAGFGLSPEEQGKVFDQILDGDLAVLARLRDKTPELVRLLTPLLDLKGDSSSFLKNLKAVFDRNLPEFAPALDNFITVADLLTAIGIKYEIDIASGRGFEYYTGVMFQLFVEDIKIGGGGRYDALIPLLGGEDVPASGFALYVPSLLGLVKAPAEDSSSVSIIARSNNPGVLKSAFDLAQELRAAGFVAVLNPAPRQTGVRWHIEVRAGAARFTVSGSGKASRRAKDIASVLRLLRGSDAH